MTKKYTYMINHKQVWVEKNIILIKDIQKWWVDQKLLKNPMKKNVLYLIYKFTTCVRASISDTTVPRFNPPTEPARTVGRTDRFSTGEPARTDGLCIISTNARWSVCLWAVSLSVTTGRREKWREKDKMTVGWRAFEVLKPRSSEPNTEGLKPRS